MASIFRKLSKSKLNLSRPSKQESSNVHFQEIESARNTSVSHDDSESDCEDKVDSDSDYDGYDSDDSDETIANGMLLMRSQVYINIKGNQNIE